MKLLGKFLIWFNSFLVLHLIWYCFTDMPFWGQVDPKDFRAFMLFMLHILSPAALGGYSAWASEQASNKKES